MANYDDRLFAQCSFCGSTSDEVNQMIAGTGVHICDRCVRECMKIIEMEEAAAEDVLGGDFPTPREMFDYLNQYVIGQETATERYFFAVS